jgi:hypothetical protein
MKRPCHSSGSISRTLSIAALCFLVLITVPIPAKAQDDRRELETLDPSFQESVLRGWRYFHTSFADDGVACVHCHRDHADIVSWAGSYPKVQIFDQTPYRVKTLRMVLIEAMTRHTDLGSIERGEMAEDLQAYIAWWGDGQPLRPGKSTKGTPPEEDLDEFDNAVSRGRALFDREKPISCNYCHTVEVTKDRYRKPLKDVLLGFPRSGSTGERAVSLDMYLLAHYRRQGVVMNTRSITDIAAYLANLSRGEHQRPGARPTGEETTP